MPPLSWTLRDSPVPHLTPREREGRWGTGLTPSVSGRVRTYPLLSRVPFRPQSFCLRVSGAVAPSAPRPYSAGARPLLRACNQPAVCSTPRGRRPAGCRLSRLECPQAAHRCQTESVMAGFVRRNNPAAPGPGCPGKAAGAEANALPRGFIRRRPGSESAPAAAPDGRSTSRPIPTSQAPVSSSPAGPSGSFRRRDRPRSPG